MAAEPSVNLATANTAGIYTRTSVARGIVMMCLGSLCFNLNDATTKFLVQDYPVTAIIFIRSLVAMPLLFIMSVAMRGGRVRWSKKLPFHALRGAINLVAAYLYIRGLEYLSVAEATVILFALPLIVTVGSVLFFRESVGWTKWAAGAFSFAGVIIAMQPGAATFQPASLFILAASFLYASNSLTARYIPEADSLWTVSFFAAAFSALFVAPVAIPGLAKISGEDLLLFAAAALCSSLGVGLGSMAYRLAPASDLAPFGYSGLIWSMAVTWFIFGMFPAVWTLVGASLVLCSSTFYFATSRRKGPVVR